MVPPETPPRGGGEAQAADSVGDELEAPKADGFAKGKDITWGMLTSCNGDEP
jgi:hypothetical protein